MHPFARDKPISFGQQHRTLRRTLPQTQCQAVDKTEHNLKLAAVGTWGQDATTKTAREGIGPFDHRLSPLAELTLEARLNDSRHRHRYWGRRNARQFSSIEGA